MKTEHPSWQDEKKGGEDFDVRVGDDGVSRGEAFLAPVYPPCPGLRRPHLGSAGADGSRAGSNISTLGASGGALRGQICPRAIS